MIEEAYVSFETAKLLKEKGFDESCYTFYEYDSKEFYRKEKIPCYNSHNDDYAAPTQQMAMRWLREVHNKHCDVGYDIDLDWFFQIIGLKEIVEYDYLETKYYHAENEIGFNTYEEAVEAALKYTLENLI